MSSSLRALVGADTARLDLSSRGRLRATGSDRVRFLSGMLSNALEDQAEGEIRESLQLDRKGHLLAELWVWREVEAVLLDAAPGTGAALSEILSKHIVADDVELQDLGSSWSAFALEGAGSREVARSLGLVLPEPGRFARTGELRVAAGGALTPDGLRLVGPRAEIAECWEALEVPELGHDAALCLRVEAGLPARGHEIDERTFPQEVRLEERAVSFTKGCYIGQEIVARIQSRGAVNRLLVRLSCAAAVDVGAAITRDGREVGRVRSAAVSPEHGPLALAIVKRDAAEPGTELSIGEIAACVRGR